MTGAPSFPAKLEGAAARSRLELWLFVAQRISAMLLAPLVLLHLAVIVYAVQGGLDAAEILGRTRGSVSWGGLYALFAVAVAVHGPIGLRTVIREMTPWHGRSLDWAALALFIVLLALGLRAVAAVVL